MPGPWSRAPADGLAMWTGPSSGDPTHRVAPHTPVEILRRHGSWALVRTADGLTGWVDGRRLTPGVPGAPGAAGRRRLSWPTVAFVGAVVAVVATAVAVYLAAGGGELAVDPASAHRAVEAMLPTPADLPGSGWTARTVDPDSGADPAPVPACRALTDLSVRQERFDAEHRVAVAARELTDPDGRTVTVQVAVYDTTDGPGDLLASFGEALGSGDYTDCLRETLNIGPDVTVTRLTPTATPPAGGVATALRLAGAGVAVATEVYAWSRGNVVVTVELAGDPVGMDAALSRAAVDATGRRVDAVIEEL